LQDIFKDNRSELEEKWNDLKLFIEYGMLTDEKFYEKALKFFFFTNTDKKLFTWDEYKALIEPGQTDKDKKLVYLYATNQESQFSFIDAAKSKGYDVLLMDDVLATPLLNHFEQKYPESHFVRVDADVVDKLIVKEDHKSSTLSTEEKNELSPIFQAVIPKERGQFVIDFQDLGENGSPMVITQNEFMRRMKDMSKMQAGMSFYGEMPDSYNLVVNLSHPLVKKVLDEKESQLSDDLGKFKAEISRLSDQKSSLEKMKEGKKDEEVPQEEKDLMNELREKTSRVESEKRVILEQFGAGNPLTNQLVDLAFLANNMLKGEALANFVKRSIEMIR
jgi:molecular chaperone HtpG